MATTKEIKRRIKSVKNTKKMTKAMELVAASKMRRAVEMTIASRTYAEHAWNILQALKREGKDTNIRTLQDTEGKNILLVLVTSNRGLCGAYNAQVIKSALKTIRTHRAEGATVSCITVGKKGEQALHRAGLSSIISASFPDLPEHVSLKDALPIAQIVLTAFNESSVDRVTVAYTDYKSALLQTAVTRQLLPVSIRDLESVIEGLTAREREELESVQSVDYLYEPDRAVLMPILVERLTKMQLYQMFLESRASEHSARMIAMKNASESAGEMIDELTLEFNKARQAAITREISEISAGMATVG